MRLGLGNTLVSGFVGGSASPTGLLTGLLSFWELDETSGTRIDAHGSINLSSDNGVGSAAGKINNAASFNDSWFSSSNTYDLTTTGFSVSTWVNGTPSDIGPVMGQWQSGIGFLVGLDSGYFGTDKFTFVLGNEPSYYIMSYAYSSGWHHLVGVYDPVADTAKLYVDGVLRDTETSIPTIPLDGSATFKMGTVDTGGEFVYNGLVDSTGLWNRQLSDSDVSLLYNSGSGLPYSSF
jgi:hypothetical protein